MSMREFNRDAAMRAYWAAWSRANGVRILSASSPDSAFKRQYARDLGARLVPDPRETRTGWYLVVVDNLPTNGSCDALKPHYNINHRNEHRSTA